MLRVKFKKIHNNHNRLRDDEIIGKCTHIPEIGTQFVMFGEPKDKTMGDCRRVNTSLITSCAYFSDAKKFVIETESGSVYEIEILDDKDPFMYRNLALKGSMH